MVAPSRPHAETPPADTLLELARALPMQRLASFMHEGQRYFVKMPEAHLSWRRRLQKGPPARAFAREIALLDAFGARGAAVPRVLAREDRRVVLSDQGESVNLLLLSNAVAPEIYPAMGAALAGLHRLGLAHGRPSIRDICWDGVRATFLDLEAGARLDARPSHQARDLLLLLHSVLRAEQAHGEERTREVIAAYRAQDLRGVWAHARRLSRQIWWLEALARPLIAADRRSAKRNSEFLALAQLRGLVAGIG